MKHLCIIAMITVLAACSTKSNDEIIAFCHSEQRILQFTQTAKIMFKNELASGNSTNRDNWIANQYLYAREVLIEQGHEYDALLDKSLTQEWFSHCRELKSKRFLNQL